MSQIIDQEHDAANETSPREIIEVAVFDGSIFVHCEAVPRICDNRHGCNPEYGEDETQASFDFGANDEEGGYGMEVHADDDESQRKSYSRADYGPSFCRY